MEARYKGKGTRYYPDTIAMMREGAEGSSVLFGLLYDDGDKEEGALGINLRRVGETKLVVAAPVTPVAVTAVAVAVIPVAVTAENTCISWQLFNHITHKGERGTTWTGETTGSRWSTC